MKEHQVFPEPIITPTTKAELGHHDENISREQIIALGLVSEADLIYWKNMPWPYSNVVVKWPARWD
jgi:phosphoribosylaminoimidazole-succinocarboxamide synthase